MDATPVFLSRGEILLHQSISYCIFRPLISALRPPLMKVNGDVERFLMLLLSIHRLKANGRQGFVSYSRLHTTLLLWICEMQESLESEP
ncbi:hypothetical protein LG200_12785 [Methylobacillus caricis]|uniref:hypothetical protein n=1 Tax=Methylobacillus caricis TaxID=1971611 RepID=UPI001CFFBBAF|nr:hypothetical protein [Methylobacillus caricis]MCB5188879.1 hypothetical protein [Methylobacillus caricis]